MQRLTKNSKVIFQHKGLMYTAFYKGMFKNKMLNEWTMVFRGMELGFEYTFLKKDVKIISADKVRNK